MVCPLFQKLVKKKFADLHKGGTTLLNPLYDKLKNKEMDKIGDLEKELISFYIEKIEKLRNLSDEEEKELLNGGFKMNFWFSRIL